ncbi:hypothetical protein J1N35_019154 [Gossypium stocksii]|uniref:Uncharacterized protein n=1 Tax=Gossypium stocksii TaxID=47602 RepID=A0A9D4A5M2_9ROSI|nr:hypothetical protein J1N35_019154 [Gossypium stocksii]
MSNAKRWNFNKFLNKLDICHVVNGPHSERASTREDQGNGPSVKSRPLRNRKASKKFAEFAMGAMSAGKKWSSMLQEILNHLSIASSTFISPPICCSQSLAGPTFLGTHKPTPIQFAQFSRDNLDRWVLQSNRYFSFYNINENVRLMIASFYLDDMLPSLSDFVLVIWNLQRANLLNYNKLPRPILGHGRPILPTKLASPSANSILSYLAPSNVATLSRGTKVPFRCLSPTEVAYRRAQGFCYHYDKKYSWDHKCKSKHQFLLFDDDRDSAPSAIDNPTQIELSDAFITAHQQIQEVLKTSALSYNALVGGCSTTTLRFTSCVHVFNGESSDRINSKKSHYPKTFW